MKALMIAPPTIKTQVLVESDIWTKISQLEGCLESLLRGEGGDISVPDSPGRDVQIKVMRELPPRPGLSLKAGQARLLHDLASIELQAMELGVRTLAEFPEAPSAFREELAEITLDESRHLRLCLQGLQELGFEWGHVPVHVGLWQAVSREDSLLDRILIVHRYLEGSGLDASDAILRRLSGVEAHESRPAIEVIRRDEVGHVQFGSRWYKALARASGVDPCEDFCRRLSDLTSRLPRRMEAIQPELRRVVGFADAEIDALEALRRSRL